MRVRVQPKHCFIDSTLGDLLRHAMEQLSLSARAYDRILKVSRTDQPQGDGTKPPGPALLDPRGTIMGERQRTWLLEGLTRSSSNWNVLAQQVTMARIDTVTGPDVGISMDKWGAYEFERRRVLKHLSEARVLNPVVLTGDIHNNWANELIADFDQLDSRGVATEFVGTSITSGGDGGEDQARFEALRVDNPFVKFRNNERGYVVCAVTAKEWRTDFRTIPYITRRNAPLTTRASFVVEAGRPILHRAS